MPVSLQAKRCFLRRAACWDGWVATALHSSRAGVLGTVPWFHWQPAPRGQEQPPRKTRPWWVPMRDQAVDSPVSWRNLPSDFLVNPVILSDITSRKLSSTYLFSFHFFCTLPIVRVVLRIADILFSFCASMRNATHAYSQAERRNERGTRRPFCVFNLTSPSYCCAPQLERTLTKCPAARNLWNAVIIYVNFIEKWLKT